jgi:nitrogen regulatory protein PII
MLSGFICYAGKDYEVNNHKLITTIVKRGFASNIVSEIKEAGAGGSTVFFGRGIKTNNSYLQALGVDHDPEKEIILTIVESEMADEILELIIRKASLNRPGNGIAFVLDIKNLYGVAHLINLQSTLQN